MSIKTISASGFDYLALGHIHKPQILLRDKAAYAGALEPIDRNDLGEHGYIEGHLENGRLRTNFVPFASRSYEQIILMLRENSTQASLEDMLKADLANQRQNEYVPDHHQGSQGSGTDASPGKTENLWLCDRGAG